MNGWHIHFSWVFIKSDGILNHLYAEYTPILSFEIPLNIRNISLKLCSGSYALVCMRFCVFEFIQMKKINWLVMPSVYLSTCPSSSIIEPILTIFDY